MSLRIPQISFDDSDQLAALCKAGGDSLRLNVLRALANDSFGVLELAQIFAIGQSGISHHLKVMTQAGLLATRREGNAIFYRRALPQLDSLGGKLQAALLEEVDQLSLPFDVQGRIAAVHAQRSAASEDFFARMASSFQARQDMIAGLPQYHDSVVALLDALNLSSDSTALEVGPGDGSFLPVLAHRFARVVAVDNSPAMLELARSRCEQDALENVELKLADALQDECPSADCVVLNMVLHHLAAPGEALKQLARLVNVGGSLLITELCSHNQSWAKEACGDLWLGFEQDDLARWADAAGLTPGESLYIGLKNGFQIQTRYFSRLAADSRLTHR
ncbi:ArsR/SmtB family transcription factor [Stutzerimonas stutzeri]|uniref:ArsR/SmtB family transcription factor n=1 Tax=Stutzerimonas stutzeri TaxID=316 RepID=UPI000316C7D9|nr:metalloregulator ArsR/SmtB family transcription factor [Stutzerimonas stutzeri]